MRDPFYWQAEAHQRLSRYYSSQQMLFAERKCDNTLENNTFLIIKAEEIDEVIKIVGDLKNYMSNFNVNVLFRGQRKHHDLQQQPTIARTDLTGDNFEKQLRIFKFGILSLGYTSVINKKYSENQFANEAILQHYGFYTRYLDLVDDIATALWFASTDLENRSFSVDQYCYVFVYGVSWDKKISNGVFDGRHQRLVNLREASIPEALRPHAQQAWAMTDLELLTTKTELKTSIYSDFRKYLLCVLQIPMERVVRYLGLDFEGINYAIQSNLSQMIFIHYFKKYMKQDSVENRLLDFLNIQKKLTPYEFDETEQGLVKIIDIISPNQKLKIVDKINSKTDIIVKKIIDINFDYLISLIKTSESILDTKKLNITNLGINDPFTMIENCYTRYDPKFKEYFKKKVGQINNERIISNLRTFLNTKLNNDDYFSIFPKD
ncbi:MAG: hypothetical protein HeimC3_15900 [Candidatus Heimdallarchaeota archaeon LC_3]|nr:MAG: hypothetical protein HeimC3_15900 [Candidatus Heimdallarchaeota archaeon LC_3]